MNSASNTHHLQESSDVRNSSISGRQSKNKPSTQPSFNSNSRHNLHPRYARVTALLLGLATIICVIVGVIFLLDKNEVTLKKEVQQNENFQGIVSVASLQEHNVPEDCWLSIHGNVYDLTKYAVEHPGGPEYITDFCGLDATRDYDIEHSRSLLVLVEGDLLGTLQDAQAEEETPEPTVADFTAVTTTSSPTSAPTAAPTTGATSASPSNKPSHMPSTVPSQVITQSPTIRPTAAPTMAATTSAPVASTLAPSLAPTMPSLAVPVTSAPTGSSVQDDQVETETPTLPSPTPFPSPEPAPMLERQSQAPTRQPTSKSPTPQPTLAPTVQVVTTRMPTSRPTSAPTLPPTPQPTSAPTLHPTPQPTTSQPTSAPTDAAPVCTEQFYTSRDVTAHASADDCWYILYDVVYDLTDYVDQHPGGARRVFNECGTDATTAYEKEHKQKLLAKEGMTRYVIGLLGSQSGMLEVPC